MTRHQPWFVYVPSAITVWCFTLHGGMAGRMFRRHAVRLRKLCPMSCANVVGPSSGAVSVR